MGYFWRSRPAAQDGNFVRFRDNTAVLQLKDKLLSIRGTCWGHGVLKQPFDPRSGTLSRLGSRKDVTTSAPASRGEPSPPSARPRLFTRRCAHQTGVLTLVRSADTVRCCNCRLIHGRARSADSVTEKPLPQALLRAASSTLSECISESLDASVRARSGCFDI